MIIAIDFDDTIVYNGYPGIGELKPNAKKIINKLYNEGYIIIIWTCRENEKEKDVINFLNKNNIKYHFINENVKEIKEKYGDTRKVNADIYIDDRNILGIPSWDEIYKIIHKNY
jgi:hydroxymethylpyrimidine pyrophosphatase-like HAD family hydrolase